MLKFENCPIQSQGRAQGGATMVSEVVEVRSGVGKLGNPDCVHWTNYHWIETAA